jgi:hypothetical protein
MSTLPVPAILLDSLLSLHDFERAAEATLKPKVRRLLPIDFNRLTLSAQSWSYYACAADDSQTARENVAVWDEVRFRPRVLRDVSGEVDMRTTLVECEARLPFYIGPAAMGSAFSSSLSSACSPFYPLRGLSVRSFHRARSQGR